MQAGIYARLSVVRNGEPTREIETPTERQVADGERYCKSKSWDVADRYVDAGLSGYKEVYRPEFERLLRDVQARRIQVIVCWKLDRLCRNHADFQRLWKVCERAGASLVSVQESFDTTTPHGEFVVRLLIGMAKLESQNISLRVSRALQAVAESGRPRIGGNYRAFGYADDGVTVIPREAAAIQEAARRLLKGEPVRAIARDLNDRNLYRVTGKPWTGSLLADTLGRARNAGLREYHGAVVGEAGWPAILDRPTWEQVVATLRHPGRRSQQGRPRTHLLAGMVWCGIEGCGAKMTSRPQHGVSRYICMQGDQASGRVHLSVVAGPLEAYVVAAVFDALDDPDDPKFARMLAGRGDVDGAQAADEYAAAKRSLQELSDDYYVNRVITDRGEFLSARRKLEERVAAASSRMARRATRAVLDDLPSSRPELERAWAKWSAEKRIDKQQAFLDLYIVKVVVGPRIKPGPFDHARASIEWRV